MAKSNWNGLNKLQKNLDKLSKTDSVKFSELFNSSFMQRHTGYSTIDELFKDGGFDVKSMDDFLAIPEQELDHHVREKTSFSSWSEMKKKAGQLWVKKQIGFKFQPKQIIKLCE